jgi:hypothetical protein
VTGLDHVLLDIGSKSMLRSEQGRQFTMPLAREAVRDVSKLAIDRGGMTDDAKAFAMEPDRIEETFGAELHEVIMGQILIFGRRRARDLPSHKNRDLTGATSLLLDCGGQRW